MKKPLAFFAAAIASACLLVWSSLAGAAPRILQEPDAVAGHLEAPATLPVQTLCCIPNVGCSPNTATSTCSKWAAGGWPNNESVYMLVNAAEATLSFTPESGPGVGLSLQIRDTRGLIEWQYLVGLKTYLGDTTNPEYCFPPFPNSGVSAMSFANFNGDTITFQNIAPGALCVQRATPSGPLPPPPVPALPIGYGAGLGGLLLVGGLLMVGRRRAGATAR